MRKDPSYISQSGFARSIYIQAYLSVPLLIPLAILMVIGLVFANFKQLPTSVFSSFKVPSFFMVLFVLLVPSVFTSLDNFADIYSSFALKPAALYALMQNSFLVGSVIIGIFYLREIPTWYNILGIFLLILFSTLTNYFGEPETQLDPSKKIVYHFFG